MSDVKKLRLAAKEMVEVMGLVDDDKNDIVITKTTTEDELKEIITSAIPAIDPDSDEFSDETQEVIDELTEEAEEVEEKPKAKGKKKPEPEPEEEEEEDEKPKAKGKKKPEPEPEPEEEEEEEQNGKALYEEVEGTKKLADLKEIVKGNTEFKSLRKKLADYKTADVLKDDMLEILDEEAEGKQEKAEELHKKNVGSKKVNEGKKAPVEDEDEDEEDEKPKRKGNFPPKGVKPNFTKEGSMSEYMDTCLKEGGTWEKIAEKCSKEGKKRGYKSSFSPSALKAHARYRLSKNPKFLGKFKMTDDGVK